jgi:hypothetical protein
VLEFSQTLDLKKACAAAGITTNPKKFFERPAVRYKTWLKVWGAIDKRIVDRGYIVDTLQDIVERAANSSRADSLTVALKGLEMLGKDIGMFREPKAGDIVINNTMLTGNTVNDERALKNRERLLSMVSGVGVEEGEMIEDGVLGVDGDES